MIRKSRCKYFAVVIIASLFIVISLIETRNTEQVPPLRKVAESLPDFHNIFSSSKSKLLDTWVSVLYQKYIKENAELNSDEIRVAAISANASDFKAEDSIVQIPSFKADDSGRPSLLPFEPRLTLGIILNDYNTQLKRAQDPKTFKYTLPVFHWADWTDLAILDPHLTAYGEERHSCATFAKPQRKTKSNPNPKPLPPKWCVDDSNVASLVYEDPNIDPKTRSSLKEILQSPFRTGFHVDRYSGRRPDYLKRLEGASYLHDFMNKPYSVVLLASNRTGPSRAIELNVNHETGSRQRLSLSELGGSVAGRVKQIDLRNELKQVLSTAPPEKKRPFVNELELRHEDFVDDSKQKLQQLASQKTLTPHEQNYYETLNLTTSGVEPTKYLYEAELAKTTANWAWGAHYDWRFYKEIINFTDLQGPALHGLISAWSRFVQSQGLKTWIAHGTLLSWYWNGINFPWDSDADVQMPIQELHRLARSFNQSVIVDFGPDINGDIRVGRYFLDIGTWISQREFGNGRNNIDARFIDMDTGLYVDITGLSISNTVAPVEYDSLLPKPLKRTTKIRQMDELEIERNLYLQAYNCRNKHFGRLSELSPLKLTYMEGTPVYVPNNFMKFLRGEYSNSGVVNRKFKKFVYFPRLRLWHTTDKVSRYAVSKDKEGGKMLTLGSDQSKLSRNVDAAVYTLSDEDYLEVMARDRPLLLEYLATREYTAFHDEEMKRLLKNKKTDQLVLEDGTLRYHFGPMRKDFLTYKRVKEGFYFNSKVEETRVQEKAPVGKVTVNMNGDGKKSMPRIEQEENLGPVKFQPEGVALERPRPDMG